MNIIMNTNRIVSIEDIEKFLKGSDKLDFSIKTRRKRYHFIVEILVKLKYNQLKKKDKGLVKKYLKKITNYSDCQLKRLIKLWKKGKLLPSLIFKERHKFPCIYGPTEIELLAQADEALNYPNGNSLKESLEREYSIFKNEKFKLISQISVSHIYNIRNNSLQYQSQTMHYTKTNSVSTPIGERKKPDNQGKPGYLRVDSVHQGDFERVKGVYHINLVDEVTQWEIVCCVPVISEKYLIPALENAIEQFPFKIINFHTDNGSEYINYQVKDMLNKLIVKHTKSRSRKSNDQALVEGKNGSVIRKHMGRNHIPKKYADEIDKFYQKYFNVFLNYHRVCSFATDHVDKRGKICKKYETYLTPYDKLKLLRNSKKYLKDNISFEKLDEIAYVKSDIEFAKKVKKEKIKLFNKFN